MSPAQVVWSWQGVRGTTRKRDLFWPFACLAFLATVCVAFAGLALVAEFDSAAAQREQIVIANGIRGRMKEVAHLTDLDVVWDEAVRHLDNRFDLAWAQDNIGTFLWQNSKFEYSFVLDSEDGPIYAADKGKTADPSLYAPFARSAASLVASVRSEEKRRPATLTRLNAGMVVTEPDTATSLATIKGGIYILSATLVKSDFGKATPRGPRAPIVVTAMHLDRRSVDEFANWYLLEGATLHTGAPTGKQNTAFVTLRDDHGHDIATLDWRPQTPGRKLLRRIGLPALTILLGLAAGIVLLYRRGRRATDEVVASEARATHLAYHDGLTGLPNRLLFRDRLGHALKLMQRNGETLAVHCLDLDRFKAINDAYGHPTGDQLIQQVARVMTGYCRAGDTVARLSGDEFAIIQTRATAASAALLASRLTEMMRTPVELEVGRVFIGCSIGITMVKNPAVDPAEILRQADLALYRSKETSKGQFCFFEPDMDIAVKMRRSLESDLRTAFSEGQLRMVYQPQVNIHGELTGVEALMRWHHPIQGEIGPAIFILVAEECGLIVDLGLFALRQAFEDSKRWKNLRVGINISAKQLLVKNFADQVMELIAEIGVDPTNFELEITERILLGEDPDTLATLHRLRKHGFALALDDFGTGYSSLTYLRRYPITRVKIDRSFTADLGVSDEAEAFIVAIVRLARALRLTVIAEGVETLEQQDCLIATGCTDMQGYLFSRPTSTEEIDRMWNTPGKANLAA